MPQQPDVFDLLVLLFLLAVEGACLIFFLLMTGLSYRLIARTWKRGLLLGAGVSALWIPLAALAVVCVDFSSQRQDIPRNVEPFVRVFLALIFLAVLVALVPLRATYYHVAKSEWSRVRGNFDRALAGPPRSRLLGIIVGMFVGLVSLAVTVVVFHYFHVKEPATNPDLVKLFPAIAGMSSAALAFPIGCLAVAAAVTEELIFRGGILGVFLRITRNQTLFAWFFITAVAFLWALLHIPNTDHPFLKVVQIFTFGIVLGAMTRRWGIGSAISAHVSLNACAVILSIFIPDM
jgi:membrane protease YdiL (CAAX protease family)